MADRPTASTVTDDDLDQLHADLELWERAEGAEQQLAASEAWSTRMRHQHDEDAHKLNAVRALHAPLHDLARRLCDHCGYAYPCPTIAALGCAEAARWQQGHEMAEAQLVHERRDSARLRAELRYEELGRQNDRETAQIVIDSQNTTIERVRSVLDRMAGQISAHESAWVVELRAALEGAPAEGHRYLSTGCLHGEHAYCQAKTGHAGAKTPACCKFCQAPCVCSCHKED